MRQSTSAVQRIRARLGAVPLGRLRRILIGLYLATAFLDAAGKWLATSPAANRLIARVVPAARRGDLAEASRPDGNFEIFRTASRHLLTGEDLYAEYPAIHVDRFKYSPTFALLFSPFSWLPWPLALFLWSALNALLLFHAVERVLPPRAALLAMACLHLEVMRAMQNAQSNALVAALIVLAFAALERRQAWRAAGLVALGTSVKIFPLAALTFAIPRRIAVRTGIWAAGIGAVLAALPLVATPFATLVAQYRSWLAVESIDAKQRWFSVMGLVQHWTGTDMSNAPMQVAGVLALVAPMALRRDRWDDPRFRLLYLCSVLIFVALFNHQAERASFVIAFTGAAIWFASEPGARWRTTLFVVAMIALPIMSTLVPGALFRTPAMMLHRMTLPMLAIWLVIQRELHMRGTHVASARLPAAPDPKA
ncbi:MAG: DUF2029 domain-containing protein [Gemmatimonadaceae bacterium]|nr:DUF2029 domain-containing protein [Gemmatimonadaceae bacterium]